MGGILSKDQARANGQLDIPHDFQPQFYLGYNAKNRLIYNK